ncbi:glycosyltransferase family 13, putative [Bodo saltans]|uniref:alpha-1,3-mannosyl-glycoprotein 2-beta-N-acetylglucosaminyltransferase n=1 Tax=Bodo saltans TaxID=75058 RepID=A0A0S4IIC1_BODSA|nr:glycosyltransferase family 13, putative [Bodo saltans]|eukprot:CUE71398.1 glycosyltransferase family 13, putative [Bodo saltans]
MVAAKRRFTLATVAVVVLTLVVITQALFLLSLMHSLHNNGALEEEESAAHSFTSKPKDDPADVVASERSDSAGPLHKGATWGALLDTLKHPHLPSHFETNRSLVPNIGKLPQQQSPGGNRVVQRRPTPPIATPARTTPPQPPQMPQHTISPFGMEPQAPNAVENDASPATVHPTVPPITATLAPASAKHRLVPTTGDVLGATTPHGDTSPLANLKVPQVLTNLKDAAVVILCYNRPQLLDRAIEALRGARLSGSIKKYISQDGNEGATRDVAQRASDFTYLSHPRTLPPLLSTLDEQGQPKETPGTMFLAAHYKWILDQLFKGPVKHSHVIILEDDMRVSHDFLEMFESLAPILEIDPTVWCISSWNDNGFRSFELPTDRFFRSSYFPGLGWMLKRSLWVDELSDRFPEDNWDHWMRATTTSRSRECVSPWMSRNYNMGSGGATANEEFYAQFLEPITLYRGQPIAYGDVRYLLNHDYYVDIENRVASVPPSHRFASPSVTSLASIVQPGQSYVVTFSHEEFELLAQMVGIHPSPRSFYRRMLWLKTQSADVYLVDRRLSPFAPADVRLKPHRNLLPVKAQRPGISCLEVCSSYIAPGGSGGSPYPRYRCASDQFDFINDCDVLASVMGGCPNGCTQGWGEDIPNTEVTGVGHPPQCLATEVVPTCEASFAFTQRLCPCVTDDALPSPRAADLFVEVASTAQGASCDQVCGSYSDKTSKKRWKCSAQSIASLNHCDTLRKHFPCTSCDKMEGAELPSYVSSAESGNFGKCFYSTLDTECSGAHQDTKRLCPCVAF